MPQAVGFAEGRIVEYDETARNGQLLLIDGSKVPCRLLYANAEKVHIITASSPSPALLSVLFSPCTSSQSNSNTVTSFTTSISNPSIHKQNNNDTRHGISTGLRQTRALRCVALVVLPSLACRSCAAGGAELGTRTPPPGSKSRLPPSVVKNCPSENIVRLYPQSPETVTTPSISAATA